MTETFFNTPVLFIIFNRADTTKLVFEAIRKAKPSRLYVAADGPRPHVESDKIKCAETRKIVEKVDWPCEVKTLFRETNLNCGKGPSSAISWFFEHEEEGIILEDDCLPSPSFFRFCQELLETYRHDTRVMHIGGNNFQDGWQNDENSYYFSRNGFIWGWATWRRAWQLYDFDMLLYDKLKKEGFFEGFFLNGLEKMYRLKKFDKTVAKRGNVDWWDYQWEFTRLAHSGLSIVPNKNLIKNLGFGEGATHTLSKSDKRINMDALDIEFPLKHPSFVVRDILSDRRYFSRFMKDLVLSKLKV